MMSTIAKAIAILWVLDTAILVLAPFLDKRLYRNCPQVQAARFFDNPGYGDAFSRFIYSSGGFLLLSIVFMTVLVLAKLHVYEP